MEHRLGDIRDAARFRGGAAEAVELTLLGGTTQEPLDKVPGHLQCICR